MKYLSYIVSRKTGREGERREGGREGEKRETERDSNMTLLIKEFDFRNAT